MDLNQLLAAAGAGGGMPGQSAEPPSVDTAETVIVSGLSLLKMLKHGRAGVPMEVMGLMLGQFIDDYTIRCIDVFAMPQSGTGVSVEAVDPVFQTKMLHMLNQVGRPETVVGWYHSHPGFGCWLSGVDVNTQQSFEQLNPRAVAVVVDPIQSVKGKVVIDCFRCISQQTIMLAQEPRQTTSIVGVMNKPSIQGLVHGVNRHYYSMPIAYRKNELEQKMLLNVRKSEWLASLKLNDWRDHNASNADSLERMQKLMEQYEKLITSGNDVDEVANTGKLNAKTHLTMEVESIMKSNINQTLSAMLDAVVF